MQQEAVTLRVSRGTYVIAWAFLVVVGGPFLFAGFSGQRDALIIGATLMLVGVAGTALLARVRLTISLDGVSYRAFTQATYVPRAEIAGIHAGFGTGRGPAFVLVVETLPGAKTEGLRVNIKPFGRRDLRRFLEAAEQLKIPIRFDDLVAREIG
jgi:hypothetical protein